MTLEMFTNIEFLRIFTNLFQLNKYDQRVLHNCDRESMLNKYDQRGISRGYILTLNPEQVSLPPATKLGQGNIFRSVCQEFCLPRGGSPGPHRGVGEVEASGRGVGGLQAHTGGAAPCLGGSRPGGCIPVCTEATPPPSAAATAAGGTHPTGMHSCWALNYPIGQIIFHPQQVSSIGGRLGCLQLLYPHHYHH